MQRITLLTSSILIATLALTACGGGDSSPSQPTSPPATPTSPPSTPPVDNEPDTTEINTISGIITDANNTPLADATVMLGKSTVVTNQSGTYTFNLNSALENDINTSTVMIKKSGYFTTVKKIPFVPNKAYKFDIALAADQITTVFETLRGIDNYNSQIPISIGFNSVVNSSGQHYNGTANLATSYYSPDSQLSSREFPQPFSGQRENSNTVTDLANVGLIEVKLTDVRGNTLALADNRVATLTFPEASTDQKLNTIPLWYYDEEKAIWIEEGVAKRTTSNGYDSVYEADVSHLGLWSVNIPLDQQSALIEGCVIDNATKQPTMQFDLLVGGRGFETYNSIDNDGRFSIAVPSNTPLLLSPVEHQVSFSGVQIPALASNQVYNINNGDCITTSQDNSQEPVDLNAQRNAFYAQLVTLPAIVKPVVVSTTFQPPLTPTGRENIIGYQFELVNDSKITDILFKDVSEYVNTQYSKYNTISYTLQSLYAYNEKYVNDYRYWTKKIMTPIGILDSSAIGGKYVGPYVESQNDNRSELAAIIQYHSTFNNNQLIRNYGDKLLLTNTYRDQSLSNQKLGDILLYSVPKTPENISIINALNSLPISESTFDNNASCKVLTARTTNADYIEYEYHFSTDSQQYADMPIPLMNPIIGTWFSTDPISWSAEKTVNDAGFSRAVRHYDDGTYDKGVYARKNSLTVSPTEKQQCSIYNEAAKNQILKALSKVTLPSQ